MFYGKDFFGKDGRNQCDQDKFISIKAMWLERWEENTKTDNGFWLAVSLDDEIL